MHSFLEECIFFAAKPPLLTPDPHISPDLGRFDHRIVVSLPLIRIIDATIKLSTGSCVILK